MKSTNKTKTTKTTTTKTTTPKTTTPAENLTLADVAKAESILKAPKPAKKARETAKPAKTPSRKAMKPEAAARRHGRKPAAKKAPKADGEATLKPESKGAKIVALISRKGGATAAELQKAAGWQAHSVRGFLSAVAGKKLGLKVASERREDGERVYSIA